MHESKRDVTTEGSPPASTSRRGCLGWGLLGMSAALPGVARAAATSPPTRASTAHALPASLAALPPVGFNPSYRLEARLGGQDRRIDILLPPGPAPDEGYPVIYVLDGNALAIPLASLIRMRSARPDGRGATGPVVVGLGYAVETSYDLQAREQDYTLPLPDAPLAHRQSDPDSFLDVVASIQAWLGRQLPIHPHRQTLFGHSYGALLTLHALFTRPSMFQNWVAASPSIWWGDGTVLNERDRFLQQAAPKDRGNPRLLVLSGSLEEGAGRPRPPRQSAAAASAPASDPARDALRAARQRNRQPVTQARDLVKSLQGTPGVTAEFMLFEGEDHGSVQWPAIAQALRWSLPS